MKDGRGGKWSSAALLNGYSDHGDNMAHEEYVTWQREAFRTLVTSMKQASPPLMSTRHEGEFP